MKKIVVSWSGVYSSNPCPSCQLIKKIQIVQMQDKFVLGPVKIMSKGSRYFGKECVNCLYTTILSKSQVKNAKTLKYYEVRPIYVKDRVSSSKRKKYPVLNNKKREKYKKENKKEGSFSASIGVFIGLVVLVFSIILGLIIAGLSILGGLYVVLEDPERRHRAYLDKKK